MPFWLQEGIQLWILRCIEDAVSNGIPIHLKKLSPLARGCGNDGARWI
jgi:hypothetical protein